MTYARNIGFLRPSRLWLAARPGVVVGMVWIAALMPALPCVRAEPAMADAPPLTTINEAKTAAEGRLPVCVRGVLTFRIGEGFVIQDDSAGAWVEVTQARRMELLRSEIAAIMQLRPGDDVEIVGMSLPASNCNSTRVSAPRTPPRRLRLVSNAACSQSFRRAGGDDVLRSAATLVTTNALQSSRIVGLV